MLYALLLLALCADRTVAAVAEYALWDSTADHRARAIELDELDDAAGALDSFRAALHFSPAESKAWFNVGVAMTSKLEQDLDTESDEEQESEVQEVEAQDLDTGTELEADEAAEEHKRRTLQAAMICFNTALKLNPLDQGSRDELEQVNIQLLSAAGQFRGIKQESFDPSRSIVTETAESVLAAASEVLKRAKEDKQDTSRSEL